MREKQYIDTVFDECMRAVKKAFEYANMYGAASVAPDDERYINLLGQLHWLPAKLRKLKREINAIVDENNELQTLADESE